MLNPPFLNNSAYRGLSIHLLSKTEIWTLDENDDTINMKIAEPSLYYYADYPELFIVDSDFCTQK